MSKEQSAGDYAQSLREILRKMSRNDTKLQIKVYIYIYLLNNIHILIHFIF